MREGSEDVEGDGVQQVVNEEPMALSRIVGIGALVVFGEKADETLILGG